MFHSGGYLGSNALEKFISAFLYFTEYFPAVSSLRENCKLLRKFGFALCGAHQSMGTPIFRSIYVILLQRYWGNKVSYKCCAQLAIFNGKLSNKQLGFYLEVLNTILHFQVIPIIGSSVKGEKEIVMDGRMDRWV